ncbi:MAG: hypothetical protein AB1467_01075 [Candidatus Diapherotrites archaeon]
MVKYTDTQKRIALLLMHEPKTVEELSNQLNIPYDELMEELKPMLKLELVEKEGYPTKYRLKQHIKEEVKRRKELSEEDKNKLRLLATIEVQAIEEELLKKQLKEIKEAMMKEEDFLIYDIREAEAVKQNEYQSSFLEVNLSVKDFRALMRLMFLYGPVAVEVLKPQKFETTMDDLQDGLMAVVEIVHTYTDYIAKKMSREELEEFTRKLYS